MFQNICPCFKAAAGFGLQPGRGLLRWGGAGGAQASRQRVLGGMGQEGASSAGSQDPSGDLGLFLNPFLPLLAQAGCPQRPGKHVGGTKHLRSPKNNDLIGAPF